LFEGEFAEREADVYFHRSARRRIKLQMILRMCGLPSNNPAWNIIPSA
jgi:hypothetical protein